jgi:predicted DNA-binding protein
LERTGFISGSNSEDLLMKVPQEKFKVKVTVRLSRETLRKARALAARRASSISKLLAEQIEALVAEDEAYQRAERQALVVLNKGFSMGGVIPSTRHEWHER